MKKRNPPSFVILAVFTTVTIFSWIFFEVYRVLVSKQNLDINSKILEPVSPTLDEKVLNEIKNKTYFDESALQTTNLVSISPTIPVEPTVAPVASSEAEITQIPETNE